MRSLSAGPGVHAEEAAAVSSCSRNWTGSAVKKQEQSAVTSITCLVLSGLYPTRFNLHLHFTNIFLHYYVSFNNISVLLQFKCRR